MAALYCTYLIISAVGNHTHAACNLLTKYAGARKGTVVLGGLFTFIAIAQSTTHAATQGCALVGKDRKGGAALAGDDDDLGASPLVTAQPATKDTPRYQALVAAVEAGAIPASALNEMDEEYEEDIAIGEERDDERTGNPLQCTPLLSSVALLFELTTPEYSWSHIIFAIALMYAAVLLVDWKILPIMTDMGAGDDPDYEIYVDWSEMAMWMRVVSSCICIALHG